MRKIVLAAALLLSGAALAPASAQYYEEGPGYGYGPPPSPYGYGYGYRRPRPRGSSVCVTGRGPCPIGQVVPWGTPCGCIVPGFGYKRGAAG